MLYDLVRTCRGRDEVVMTDDRKKVNSRLKTLRQSHRGQHSGLRGSAKVTFKMAPSTSPDKYSKKPFVFGG